MSTVDETSEEIGEHTCALSSYTAANHLDNEDAYNTPYRLQTSHNSTISEDSDLSLLSLSLDKELETHANAIDIDELPAFEIRLISPLGRTPSPIGSEDTTTPTKPQLSVQEKISPCKNNPDFVALHDINARISPPSEQGSDDRSFLSRTSSLETIFEGVFLNTPPRQRLSLQNNRHDRSRTNLLEKVAFNRLNIGKENQSPLLKSEISPRRTAIDLNFVTDTCAISHHFSKI